MASTRSSRQQWRVLKYLIDCVSRSLNTKDILDLLDACLIVSLRRDAELEW